jgi:hypothetical protein
MGTKIQQAIGIGSPTINVFPVPVLSLRAPAATDIDYPLGQNWIRTDTGQIWNLSTVSAGSATWSLASPGASDVDTLTGDAGGAISPAAGNITLAGGTNIASTGAGSTITFNLDAAITLATSVTSPIYTAAAGLAIRAAAANNITLRMGDAAGAQIIAFTDSSDAQVASIDSDGTATFVGMDGILGAVTPAAATVTTGTASTSFISPIFTSTGAVDTNLRAVAGQDVIIRMGDAAGANIVAFHDSGNVQVASIDSDGAFTTTGLTFTGLLTANASATINTAGTALNLATDNSGDAVNIGTGTVIRAIGIGNAGAVAHTIAIGAAAAGVITVDTAAGVSIDAATDCNFTCSAATATAIVIEASNAAGGLAIRAGTGGLLIGGEADCSTIGISDIAPTTSRTVTVSGGTVVTAAVTDTLDLAPDGATTNADSVKTVNVNIGGVTLGQVLTNIATGVVTSGTHTTSIASGNRAAGTMVLNLFSGTGTKTANFGNADGLTTLNLDAITLINDSVNVNTSINTGTSTGSVAIGNTLAGVIDIDSGAAVSINSAGAAINIGNDADAFAINVGTGAAARTITYGNDTGATSLIFNCGTGALDIGQNGIARTVRIGNSTGASALELAAGTGDITITGTVKEIDAEFLAATGDDITFQQSPLTCTAADTGGVATGANTDLNLLMLQNGIIMEQYCIGAQTIIKPVMTASGLLISGDLTVAEGFEYNFGAARTNSRHAFTIGTSAAFFFECQFTVADVSSADPYMIGFRRSAANNASVEAYSDYSLIGLDQTVNEGTVIIKTELNSGGTTNTNTTDVFTDGQTHTFRVLVSAAGVVTYLIDGVAPTITAAFTFDNGDIICPLISVLHRDVGSTVNLNSLKIGFQA